MAASAERRPRRGPAPIASFDHDASDESSPENRQVGRLAEIREDPARPSGGSSLAPEEPRARSHSSPAAQLQPGGAPRIDISRASSSSHHDSRDSSPDLAPGDLGFREDGALDLRSSTEELAFLEGAPAAPPAPAPPAPPAAPAQPAPAPRRHSRKDSQGSEAALLGVSGRTSRLSSVGSQCSAHSALSALSHVSRLSVASAASRSPSPHKMLLETSFCGPKPIDTEPEICAAAVEERLLQLAAAEPAPAPAAPVDARDRREVRTEATVESARPASAPRLASPGAPPPPPAPAPAPSSTSLDDEKRLKETMNRAKVQEHRARSGNGTEPSQPEVYRRADRTKDIIRIKLKPDDEYENNDDDDESERGAGGSPARKPASLELGERPRARPGRTPSPAGAPVSRKSSFCSLFKSRETVASPDSPSDALRRKKSLNEGRSRSKSRDRSATPTSAAKIKGSVLALFKTPRRSGASPAPSSRDASPGVQPPPPPPDRPRAERLKYYEDAQNGIIHIPLRTPPDELDRSDGPDERFRDPARPASAPQPRAPLQRQPGVAPCPAPAPTQRTVLPDGSIIIPLHSPTERTAAASIASTPCDPTAAPAAESDTDARGPTPDIHPAAPEPSPDPGPDGSPPADAACAGTAAERPRRKERMIFTTHVGSKEQVFSTQFSITKTPSVTSEISESIPSFPESEEVRSIEPHWSDATPRDERETDGASGSESRASPPAEEPTEEPAEESSGSEASSEAGARGCESERRVLVVQESFEELPYVPTTLPMERSLALPMVPVRERGGERVRVAPLQRPRARRPPAPPPPRASPEPPPAAPPPPAAARLHIRLPRRARAASAAAVVAPPPRSERARSRSGGDEAGMEARGKGDWIDFSEVPERRKQPKRIQTLPAARDAVVFSYVPPERCRCECHAHAPAPAPGGTSGGAPGGTSGGAPGGTSGGASGGASGGTSGGASGGTPGSTPGDEDVHAAPFTADFDLRHNHTETTRPH